MEVDKSVEQLEFVGCWMNSNAAGTQQIGVQSSNIGLTMNNCKIRNLNGTPGRTVIRNSVFTNKINLGTLAYGCTKTVLLENCFVASLLASQSGSIGVAPANVVNGVITVPQSPPPQGLYPGSVMFATDAVSTGRVFPLSFVVLNVRTDGTNYLVDTTLPPSFSAPLVSGNYRFQRHPCPNLTVRSCYGCDAVVSASHATPGTPVNSYIRKLLTGYFGSSGGSVTPGPAIQIWGTIVSVKVNVLRPYTGALGTLTMRFGTVGPSAIATDGITVFNWGLVINVKTAGLRTITATGNTGLQTGDVDPGSGAFWFASTVTPWLSGDTSGDTMVQQALIDFEIVTDQGLLGMENFQFGTITFPGT